ncbi:uncharacterized protein LOC134216384 [Armigeres subalbatus]|uniref:uncharacterized protein LOC134216384 n=1 Tax=Armigeres subalbatus TaxID=124917 RepID=UPI002ED6256F
MVGTSPMLLHTSSYAEDPINSETALMENVNTKSAISQTSIGTQFSRAEGGSRITDHGPRRISISNFLQLPPTPKRKQIKRNYKQKRHFILTAAERIQELEQKEQEKENAAIRRQEAVEQRASKKADVEKKKQERKILLEQRRALKKVENEKKKELKDKMKNLKLKNKRNMDKVEASEEKGKMSKRIRN